AQDNDRVASVDLLMSYSRDGVAFSNAQVVLTQTASPFTYRPAEDGVYRFSTVARDATGNVEIAPSTPDVQVTVDRTAPLLNVEAPVAGPQPEARTLSVRVVDANPLASLSATLDGTPVTLTFANGLATAPLGELAKGDHVIVVRIVDAAGNVAEATRSFKIDPSKPAVALTTVPTPLLGPVDVTVTAITPRLDRIVVKLDGQTLAEGRDATLTLKLDPAALASGNHLLEAVVTDLAGETARATASFLIDAAPPLLGVEEPVGDDLAPGDRVRGRATDDDAVSRVELLVQGTVRASTPTPDFDFTVDATGLQPGTHQVTLQATDRAGNLVQKLLTLTVPAASVEPPTQEPPTTTPPTQDPPTTTPPTQDETPGPGLLGVLAALGAVAVLARRKKQA
ncbi:MAG TPA: Ig-like domain-containing protein, partial [Candidatus Thermoplasmatota archaeon]|nr:Ig-like domain-containing protein [Candidatus Thermoplasmatota archaeon]